MNYPVWILYLLVSLSGGGQAPPAGKAADLALVGAKIYSSPTTNPIVNGVVLIKEGKITAVGPRKQVQVPPNTTVVDCNGLVLTAGFWNCHVHFMEAKWQRADSTPAVQLTKQLEQMLTRYGFSYAFDLATLDWQNLKALRHRIETGEVAGPTIFTAGVPFTPSGGSPFYIAPLKLPEVGTPQLATEYVTGQLAAGADAIKLWSASPIGRAIVVMPPEVAKAAVAAAHRRGKPVFAHPTNDEGVAIAIESGIDVLTHVAPEDRNGWTPETLNRMLAHHMALIPSLKLYKWDLEQSGKSIENNSLLKTALQQAGAYSLAGGDILFGTDVGFMTDYSPVDEYALMAKAGMSFAQILASLTLTPARRFGLADHAGSIAVGMDADLVLLGGDPASDISGLAKVAYTYHKGKLIYRSN